MTILTTDGRDYGLAGLSLIIVGGVIRAYMQRVKGDPGRLKALEIKVQTTSEGVIKADARIVDLEKLLDQRTGAIDDKMDIVLEETKQTRAEMKELREMMMTEFRAIGERVRATEKDVEHAQRDIEQLHRQRGAD